MSFEILYALQVLGSGIDPYLLIEALDNYEITMKRNAVEVLKDLGQESAIDVFIEKIGLY